MLAATVMLAAASAGPGFDPVQWVLNQGPLGLALVIIGYGWKRERDRADSERARADAERASRDELAQQFMDKVIPALVESTRVQREFVDLARRT